MRDSVAGAFVALAAVLCCALPLLFISGFLITGSGFAFGQQTILGLGIVIIIIVGISWLLFRSRRRGGR